MNLTPVGKDSKRRWVFQVGIYLRVEDEYLNVISESTILLICLLIVVNTTNVGERGFYFSQETFPYCVRFINFPAFYNVAWHLWEEMNNYWKLPKSRLKFSFEFFIAQNTQYMIVFNQVSWKYGICYSLWIFLAQYIISDTKYSTNSSRSTIYLKWTIFYASTGLQIIYELL